MIVDIEGKSLSLFEGLPHLSYPVVHDKDEYIYVIDELHKEMTRRLELDNAEINMLPYLVCIIDEFAHVSEQCDWAINDTVSDIPDSAKLRLNLLPKSPKIWYNRSIRKAEKQYPKGEEENAENRDRNK